MQPAGCCFTGAKNVSDHEDELEELKASLQDTQPVGTLVNTCRLVLPLFLSASKNANKNASLLSFSSLKHFN